MLYIILLYLLYKIPLSLFETWERQDLKIRSLSAGAQLASTPEWIILVCTGGQGVDTELLHM